MKATILNGATGDDVLTRRATDTLTGLLQAGGCEVEQIRLEELDIAPCLGCFGCWVKTPGVCVIDDAGRDLAKKAIQCDLLTFVTPITFGGYSYQLKKAADRLIPLILPYFQLVGGEGSTTRSATLNIQFCSDWAHYRGQTRHKNSCFAHSSAETRSTSATPTTRRPSFAHSMRTARWTESSRPSLVNWR